jgi:hypothetical protein
MSARKEDLWETAEEKHKTTTQLVGVAATHLKRAVGQFLQLILTVAAAAAPQIKERLAHACKRRCFLLFQLCFRRVKQSGRKTQERTLLKNSLLLTVAPSGDDFYNFFQDTEGTNVNERIK